MKANVLEHSVVNRMLADPGLQPLRRSVDSSSMTVVSREFTSAGFLTEFERSDWLKLFHDGFSLRWGKVGARLNELGIDTGYVVYIDDGYVSTVEGYTYGEEWPFEVVDIQLYDLDL